MSSYLTVLLLFFKKQLSYTVQPESHRKKTTPNQPTKQLINRFKYLASPHPPEHDNPPESLSETQGTDYLSHFNY